jgi:hypothetical protein
MSPSRRFYVTVWRSGQGELYGHVDGVETLDAFVGGLERMGWIVLAALHDQDRDGRPLEVVPNTGHRPRRKAG